MPVMNNKEHDQLLEAPKQFLWVHQMLQVMCYLHSYACSIRYVRSVSKQNDINNDWIPSSKPDVGLP